MKLISTGEAAKEKNCSHYTIREAVRRGNLDGERAGRFTLVKVNARYKKWFPNEVRQQIGRDSQKKRRA